MPSPSSKENGGGHSRAPFHINSIAGYQDAEDCYFATIIDADNNCVASLELGNIDTDGPTTRANAALFKASPKMLRAIKLTNCALLQLPDSIRQVLGPEIRLLKAAIKDAEASR